jgi:hypothetical protein
MTTIAERKTILQAQIDQLKASGPNTAYHKFLLSFRSRLVEEGIAAYYAKIIVAAITVAIAELNEEDDFIHDFAIQLAELVKLHYDMLVKHNFIGGPLATDTNFSTAVVQSYFSKWVFSF